MCMENVFTGPIPGQVNTVVYTKWWSPLSSFFYIKMSSSLLHYWPNEVFPILPFPFAIALALGASKSTSLFPQAVYSFSQKDWHLCCKKQPHSMRVLRHSEESKSFRAQTDLGSHSRSTTCQQHNPGKWLWLTATVCVCQIDWAMVTQISGQRQVSMLMWKYSAYEINI